MPTACAISGRTGGLDSGRLRVGMAGDACRFRGRNPQANRRQALSSFRTVCQATVADEASAVRDTLISFAEMVAPWSMHRMMAVYPGGLWRSFEVVEFTTLERVDLFNNCRLLELIRSDSNAPDIGRRILPSLKAHRWRQQAHLKGEHQIVWGVGSRRHARECSIECCAKSPSNGIAAWLSPLTWPALRGRSQADR